MKRYPGLFLLALFFSSVSSAQLFPGIKVNGRTIVQGDTVNVCKGSSLTYEAGGFGFSSVFWRFKLGTPSTSTLISLQTVRYNTVGIDSTIQTISNGLNSDSTFIYVKVSDIKPAANYTFSPDNVCGNIPVAFSNTSTGLNNSYRWEFDDGSFTGATSPPHQFLTAIGPSGTQTFNVKLIATNFYGCRDSVTRPVTIKKIPDATIGNADAGVAYNEQTSVFKVCTNTPSYEYQFINQSSTIASNVSYKIIWGDGSPDSVFTSWPAGNIIRHIYTIGSRIMTVEATGSSGCTGIKKYTVFLGTNPAGGFSSLGNTNICAPDSLGFVITGYQNNASGTTYTITVNDGSPLIVFSHPPPDTVIHEFLYSSCGTNSSNGTISFNNSYNAILTIENPCDITSVSVIPIYVSGKPRARFGVSPSNTVCTGSNTTLKSTSLPGGIVTSTGGGSSTCDNAARLVWEISPSTGYALNGGSLGSLNGNSSNGFVWTPGSTYVNVIFSVTGTYTVKLYIFNERCGYDSTVQTICVRNPPVASFTMSNHSACLSGTANLTNSSPSGLCLGDIYQWSVQYIDPLGCGNSNTATYSFINGTDSLSLNPVLRFDAPGKYAVSLTVAAIGSGGSCDPGIKTDTFTVKGRPKVTLDSIGAICVNTSLSPTATVSGCYADSALQYAWAFTNGSPPNSSATLPSAIFYNQTGSFPVQLAVTNECGTGSSASNIEVIEPPVASAGEDTTVCQDDSLILLTATPAGGLWSGSSSVTATGEFNPSAPGIYNLVYTFGLGPCTAADTIQVTVRDSINNNLISPDQSICINTRPAIITGLDATGGGSVPAYQWQQSADSSSWTDITGATSRDYTPPALDTTVFFRRLAYTSLCFGTQGSFSNAVKIIVRENALSDFTASQAVGCIPFDLSTVINVTPYPERNGQYQWFADNVPLGSNNTGLFPGFIMQNADDTTVITLITISPFGCLPDTISISFITTVASIAQFTKDTSGGCAPITASFINTSSAINNNIQFFWDFGNGMTSNDPQPAPVTFEASPFFTDTTYQISLKTFNGCDTSIWRDSILILSKPKARFGVVSTFGCSPFTVEINNATPGSNNTYYWDFGNGDKDTTFANGPLTYTYNTGTLTDTVTLQLIAVNQCGIDTQAIELRIAPNVIIPQININAGELFGCAPHTVGFINGTSGGSSYTWDFGDGSQPVITNNNDVIVTHTYADSGTFNVKVDITNGCSDTVVFRQVTVYLKPAAAFTASADVYCLGDTIRVSNASSNANSYRWFWGDDETSTGSEPFHIYPAAGNYIIYLRAERTNSSGIVCFDTLVRPVTVLIKPDVTVQSNVSASNCAPFTLDAAAPGIINEDAAWYIYDSTVSPSLIIVNGAAAHYVFNKPGTFVAKFIAGNSVGCKDSTVLSFTVSGTPDASFNPGDLLVCSLDTTISYINTTTYNDISQVQYSWIVDNLQLAATGNFTHRYTAPAGAILPRSFTTLLIASNAGCADTAAAVLQMSPRAEAQFSIGNTNTCVPFTLPVTDNSQYATSYKWFVNGVLTDTTANPAITITEGSVVYNIMLIADNIFGCRPDTFLVRFTSKARPHAVFTVNDSLGCTGVLNVATNNQTTGANFYQWDWGDNSQGSTLTSPTHLYNIQGQYLISLIASDGACGDTAEQIVRVSVKPDADFKASDSLTCDTARVQFFNLTTGGSDNNVWSFGDGTTSMEVNPVKSFSPRLTPYTVKLVVDNGLGCKDSLTRANLITVKVPPATDFFISPSPVITVPNYTFTFNNLTPNSTRYFYQWNLGDGSFANTRDVMHQYNDTGSYAVQLIVLDTSTNCPDTMIRIARVDGFPGYLYVPNAICPGCLQSGLREFLPKGKGLAQYRLQIFTTWGELIFETNSINEEGAPDKSWDGRYKNVLVQQDVYVWRIDARFKNNTEWLGMSYPGDSRLKKAGTITVVK